MSEPTTVDVAVRVTGGTYQTAAINGVKASCTAGDKQAAERLTTPGQLTHSDLCGPMETPSLTGKRYAVVFIDDATRHAALFLIKEKTETLRCFQEYVGMMKPGIQPAFTVNLTVYPHGGRAGLITANQAAAR